MNKILIITSVFAFLLYVPLCVSILKGQIVQNMTTWFLWGVLDAVAAASLYVQDGNFWLPAAYSLGCIVTVLCIFKSGEATWTRFSTLIICLVIICMIGWYYSGPKLATILSTLAMVVAGLPQLIDTWKYPLQTPLLIFIGYFSVNTISCLAGNGWTITERFYPGVASLFCLAVCLSACRNGALHTRLRRRIPV